MTAAIEDRLRRHYDDRTRHLPLQGSGVPPASQDVELVRRRTPKLRRPRLVALVGASAAVVLAGSVLILRSGDQGGEMSGGAASAAPADTADEVLEPAESLPDSDDVVDVPVTVVAARPSDWFRIAPDVDVAWYAPSDDGASMFCWRTPEVFDCAEDGDASTLPVVAATAGNQTVVIGGGPGDEAHVGLDDDGAFSAPVVVDQDVIELGVARFELPAGATVVSSRIVPVGTGLAGSPEPADVTGATLPPAADLVDVPVTLAPGSPLYYWRFLPDLDISERATADGIGTELCWRTPAGTDCVDDTFTAPDVAVIPTDGAVIFLARPSVIEIEPPPTDPLAPTLEVGPEPTSVSVELSDGTLHDVPLTQGEVFGVWYGRLDLQEGESVVSATSH